MLVALSQTTPIPVNFSKKKATAAQQSFFEYLHFRGNFTPQVIK